MSPNRYAHLLGFALSHPWAITPEMLRLIAGILGERIAGQRASDEQIAAARAARKPDLPQPSRGGGVFVIPFHGVVAPRANLFVEASGGTSFEGLRAHLREGVGRDDVKTIVFDVDSPGGSVAGATEFAADLRAARARKPIIACVNHTMASAAYWTMANATKVHASPSAMVGSLGVLTIHDDLSAALAALGVKRTIVSAGDYKAELAESSPLSDDALAHLSGLVAQTYNVMLADIAKGRGVSVAHARDGYSKGRCIGSADALALGMVDKVATIDETIERLLPPGSGDAFAAISSPLTHTSQDPATDTDQDARADLAWQAQIERDLLLEWAIQ